MKLNVVTAILCSLIALTLLQRASEAKVIDGANDERALETNSVYRVDDATETKDAINKKKAWRGIKIGNNIYGQRRKGDTVLYTTKIAMSWYWNGIRNVKVKVHKDPYQINRIEIAMDHETEDTAATYQIYGGIGADWVIIAFESKYLRGVYYTVTVYGYVP